MNTRPNLSGDAEVDRALRYTPSHIFRPGFVDHIGERAVRAQYPPHTGIGFIWNNMREGFGVGHTQAHAQEALRRVDGAGGARAPADQEAGERARHRGTGRGETMKIIGGTDKDKEDEARKRADALAKAIIKMLPQHLSHRELLAALSSVLAAAFAEDGTREGVLRAMRDLTASVLAEFGALKRRQRLGQRHVPEEDGDDPA